MYFVPKTSKIWLRAWLADMQFLPSEKTPKDDAFQQ